MTVLSVFVGQPRPGKYEAAVELNQRAMKLIERHGAKNIRSLVGAIGGASYGSIINSSEFDDPEAWGAFYDKVMTDDEIHTLFAEVRGENTPFTTQTLQVVNEIPLGRKRGANGKIVVAYISAPVPGRYEAAIALTGQGADLLERHGARNCRVFAQVANGLQPDVLVSTAEYDTMKAYGKALGAFTADTAGLALMQVTMSSDSPIRLLSSDVYAEIPG